MDKRTLIIYSGHEINDNLVFFSRNGYIDDPKYDFIFIFNNSNLKLEFSIQKSNIKILTRPNFGLDFGGWTDALFSKENDKFLYEKYDYFIFMNSTVRGPFLPLYYDQKLHGYWPEIFTSKLNDEYKLVGPAVAFYLQKPFISSALFVTDRIGLDIAMKKSIFDPKTIKMDKVNIVTKKEIGFSNAIIEAGYNIKSLLYYYKDINLKTQQISFMSHCHLNPNNYYGINVNPYEIIFIKQNRKIEPAILNKYTEWHIRKTNNVTKILYGLSENNAIDVTDKLYDHVAKRYNIRTNLNINQLAGQHIFPGRAKKLFIYSKENNIEHIKVIDEHGSFLKSNVIFI